MGETGPDEKAQRMLGGSPRSARAGESEQPVTKHLTVEITTSPGSNA